MSDVNGLHDHPEHTGRGFEILTFSDRYGVECQLQQSSLAEFEPPGSSAVWLGTENERMHLDQPLVQALIERLQTWLDTGSFDPTATN